MKIIKSVILDKYQDNEKYAKISDNIYEDLENNTYCICLHCKLEKEEDTQYPLEDILDQYSVNCTDYMEIIEMYKGKIYVFELEGSLSDKQKNLENIRKVENLIGKRVFNYEENGAIGFKIE